MKLAQMNMKQLLEHSGFVCTCGKTHACAIKDVEIGHGVVARLPHVLKKHGIRRPFIVCDANTYQAAMAQVENALHDAGMEYTVFNFGQGHVEPDESSVGALTMAFDKRCDLVLAVGSGVIHDCSKVLAYALGIPSAVIATAPSMDGYASSSASMIQRRVKVSISTGCSIAIIADTAIIKNAPMRMLQAGFGDMIAKYCALCEWQIASIVTGEAYCAEIADMVRKSVRQVSEAFEVLADRDEDAVGKVVGGLILCGIAMSFAGLSRPASGQEHYFSHMWEMMDLDRGNKSDLHGIQVGVGTILTLKVFDWLKGIKPDPHAAQTMMANFSQDSWREQVKRIFGKAAPVIIESEEKLYLKNSLERHAEHLQIILSNWDTFLSIMQKELPDTQTLIEQMRKLNMPVTPADIGVSDQDVRDAWLGSREIRDKYLCTSLAWDLGLMDEAVKVLLTT